MILAINLLSSLKSDIPWVGYIIHPTVLYEIYVKIEIFTKEPRLTLKHVYIRFPYTESFWLKAFRGLVRVFTGRVPNFS